MKKLLLATIALAALSGPAQAHVWGEAVPDRTAQACRSGADLCVYQTDGATSFLWGRLHDGGSLWRETNDNVIGPRI